MSKVKPTTSAEPVSTITSECAQAQDRLSGTITNKHDITGTTTVIAIKGTTSRIGDIGTTSSTDDIPAGTTTYVANIDSDIEFAGTTNSVRTTTLDEFTAETKEVVIGSIDSDASTLQLLVSGNAS